MSKCNLCERENLELTFHHLIPKCQHKRNWCKKKFTKEEMKKSGINVCIECHKNIHRLISNVELAKFYYTLELLLEHPKIKKFLGWIKKQK